jgi:Kef-type K+ transport system membrane component KefB
MNPTAIESHLKMVLWQWIVIIALAWLFGRLARRFRQPLAVGEITAGLLLGPSVLGALWPEGFTALFTGQTQQSLQLLGKIGVILLLFQVGMEFDFGHLRHRTSTITMVSLTGLVAPIGCALLIGPWLHRTFAPQVPFLGFQLFVCVALSITALPIMGRILLEMNLERTALGAISVGAAAIDDVVGWILLAVVTALTTSGFRWESLLLQTAGVGGLFLLLLYVVGPWLRSTWRRLRGPAVDNSFPTSFLALLLIVLFACALATHQLGVFSIFGAFLLGVSLHQETSLARAWREKFADLVLVAFVPVFFTNTGLRTEVGSLSTSAAWVGCLLVLAAAVVGKFGGCYAGARLTKASQRDSVCIASLMNTRGLMGLVAINVGADLGLFPREVFTMFVMMALLTTAMTGPLLRLWLPDSLRALLPDAAHRTAPPAQPAPTPSLRPSPQPATR